MEVSDGTRDWILSEAKRSEREKARARALRQAEFNDVIDNRLLDGVKNSIIRTLERDGEQAGNALRSRMGKRERRDLFDQAVALLEHEGRVAAITVERGTRYRLTGVQGEPPVQGHYSQVSEGEPTVQGEPEATVTELDSRRSNDAERPKLSAPELVAKLVSERRAAGETTITSLAVHTAGKAAGHAKASITNAITKNPDMVRIDRDGGTSIYSIDGTGTPCQSFSEWARDYILALPANIEFVDKEDFARAAEAADHNAESASRTVLR
ncbi:MAG: hypothetical protein ACRDXB_22790, partial [Actinomycetes bacterium]